MRTAVDIARVVAAAGVFLTLLAFTAPVSVWAQSQLPSIPQDQQKSVPDSNLQVPQRIVALVNDEPVSAYDVVQRLRLTIASIGGIESQEQLARLEEQVVRNIVDDKLKLQEAAEFELVIPPGDLERAFASQAQNFNQSPQQFEDYLAQLGVDKAIYLEQMESEIAWGELVNGRLGRMANVAQEEVEQELGRIKANAGKPEYQLSEIYLLVSNPSRVLQVQQTAQRLVSQLREGGNFAAYARQFSQSTTAASGGALGWVTTDQLDDALAQALESLEVGELSMPVRTPGGFHILKLEDRRRVLGADMLDMQIDVKQIFMPMNALNSEKAMIDFVDQYDALRPSMTSCADIDSYASELNAPATSNLGTVRLRELPTDLRPLVRDLEVGHPTRPTRMQDGFRIFFVCDRSMPKVEMPTFEEVIDRLERQKLAMMARRYLRDLRRNAVVDYRTTSAAANTQQ